MTMTNDRIHDEPLSPQGTHRKQAILATAEQALVGRVRARRSRRSLASFALLIGCAALMPLAFPRPEIGAPKPLAQGGPLQTAPHGPQPVERLDDDAMLAALAAIGVDAGMIDIDGEQKLVTPEGKPLDIAALNQSFGS